MKKALNLLFWGYLFVFVRIELGIDLLPEPLGYFMIATGCLTLGKRFPTAKKARAFAIAMIFVSFPTIFINVQEQTHILLNAYSTLLMILQLIVVFFIFQLLIEIVTAVDNPMLINRTERTFKIYIIANLIFLAASTFTPNTAGDYWEMIILSLMLIAFIMDIVFLVLLRAIRRDIPTDLNI
ncbi:hypothetical protein [Sporosarcina ureilytica]|uniref:Uncharacterized protein n=1 Tax=Sporosarcina ureilytica TaxID=298596 RepID=A0A1D8JBW4_9BACL|nr:hypothetical protein [Sporosarcina ureilytica]AOV06189.1 hypothetical protein BI350_00075 [Sporosarcina ureilytica]